MKVLIIGGTGFIGSQIAKKFVSEDFEVFCFSRNIPDKNKLDNVSYFKGDMKEKNTLMDITKNIDLIFHCGSSSTPSKKDSEADEEKNTINLVDSFFHNNVKRFVFFSSGGAIYGDNLKEPSKENDTPNPISDYGITKYRIEKFLVEKFKHDKKRILILRPSNPYGLPIKNNKRQGVVPIFLNSLKMRKDIEVFGDGSTIKDYIYIDDLIQIIFNLAVNNNFGIYNIGSGTKTSINELIEILFKVTKLKAKVIYKEPLAKDVNFFLSTDKVFSHQEHTDLVNIEDGINKFWNDSYFKT